MAATGRRQVSFQSLELNLRFSLFVLYTLRNEGNMVISACLFNNILRVSQTLLFKQKLEPHGKLIRDRSWKLIDILT